MAVTKYTYTKEANLKKLQYEINSDHDIAIGVDYIFERDPDQLDIYMKDALSASEKTELDAIVAAHDNTPLPEDKVIKANIVEETTPTGGHYGVSSIMIDLTNDTPDADGWYSTSISWPFPITLISGQCEGIEDMVGDETEFVIAPNTITGSITSDVASGDTVINVGQTVIDNTFIGSFINLTDGVNNDDLGRVLDVAATSITCETATSNDFDNYIPGYGSGYHAPSWISPTYVRQSVKLGNQLNVGRGKIEMGTDRHAARSPLPANTVLKMKYKKTNGNDAQGKIIATLGYLY
jgi:hypothetical protein